MPLACRQIAPALEQKEYTRLKSRSVYVTSEMGRNEIEPNIVYWDWAEHDVPCRDTDKGSNSFEWRVEKRQRKQIKFCLLPKAIPEAAYIRLLGALRSADWDDCQRGASGQRRGMRALRNGQFKPGTKLTVGFFPQKPGYIKGNGWTNMRSASTMEQPELMSALRPTLQFMDDKIRAVVPEYHDFALRMALRAWRPDNEKEDDYGRVPPPPASLKSTWSPSRDLRDMSDEEINREYARYRSTAIPDPVAIIQNLDGWHCTYTLFGTVFSTVELNQTIVFKAHEDGNNVLGTLVGITALGSFVGGRLVFPRYGYSAELGPRDLLICDNNHELHGNLGPVIGERFSVVAFLHKSVCNRGDQGSTD
jgi:hypothetical protein